ncbi:hypothetical protein WAI453_002365 [Rhynchosporium graminicola]|uniref:Extracellular metalloproteinase n=1 Tax=Rhynchosporium graminicola TaxID=2792576 RepID=A0A1E1KNZ1_9HELO|nr:probable Extracellular metalloproteinase MEP [Rhynchosporium commune]
MRFLSRAGAVALLASNVLGHPASQHSQSSTRGLLPRTIDLSRFRITTESTYSNATATAESDISSLTKRVDYVDTASAVVSKIAPGAEFRVVSDHYVSENGIAHVYFKQTAHGLDIDNADFNVNVAADGSIFSFGNSFFTGAIPAKSPLVKRDTINPVAALTSVTSTLSLPIEADAAVAVPEEATEHYVIQGSTGTLSEPKAKLIYFQNEDSTLTLAWRVETDIKENWLLSYVDAVSGNNVLGVVDYVSDASYTVYPWQTIDPSKGTRAVETNPQDAVASEFGFQNVGTTAYTTTRGNNAIAQANYEGDTAYLNDYRPDAGTGANFNYDYSLTATDPKIYSNASVTQLFYTANMYHDLLYVLGFNERAGNFEANNNGQGGLGNDAVILNAQDLSRTDNANFGTPPDGQPGRMAMYMFTSSTPKRDCSFDAGVVIHEYTHGLSNRLTGGPANSACLSTTEAGGMGEGWSDFMAVAIHIKSTDTRTRNFPMGDWVSNRPNGIRNYLYSTSLTTNPYTYKSVNGMTVVHTIGTVWATMLYEVFWNLVEKYGITTARKPTFSGLVPTDGRFLAMKLVLDGMKLQPCSPTFLTARNAIIDADLALTKGANKCLLWKGFAKRGLGSGATQSGSTRTESYTLPSGC